MNTDQPAPQQPVQPQQQAPVMAQTGAASTPLQVENVQYNVSVGKTKSKIGVATFFMALCAWVMGFLGIALLLAIREALIPGEGDSMEIKETIVFVISGLIPFVAVFAYAFVRIGAIIRDNPAAIDDIFFKRLIRWNLGVAGIIAMLTVFFAIYNTLSLLVLKDPEMMASTVADSFIFMLAFVALALLFLRYELKTRR